VSVFYSCVGHLFSHLVLLLYPTVVLALQGRFGLSYGELLSLSTLGYALYGIGALPAGWLGDRWGAERMMVVFFLGTGGATLLTGLANGPGGLLVGLAFIGLFGSIYHPVGIAWLVRNAENRGRALGLNGIFGSLGTGGAAILAGTLTAGFGWRAAFIVPGALCVGFGVALMLSMRAGRVVRTTRDVAPAAEPDRADAIRAFVVLSVTMLGSGFVAQVVTVALPKIFEQRLVGLTDGAVIGVGGYVSLVFAVSAAMQFLAGWLADRFPLKPVYVLAWVAQVPVYLVAGRLVEVPLLAAAMAAQVLSVFAVPAENMLLARYTPGRWRATAYGAKFVLALGAAAAGVPVVGAIFDATGGFYWLFLVLAAASAVVAAAALFLPGERRPLAAAAQPAE
jgi:MFS family permease